MVNIDSIKSRKYVSLITVMMVWCNDTTVDKNIQFSRVR